MSELLKDLAKDYLLHTFDFKNGSPEKFVNEYFATLGKITLAMENYDPIKNQKSLAPFMKKD